MALHRVRLSFQNSEFEFVTDVMFQIEAFRTYILATRTTIEVDIKNEITRYKGRMKEELEQYLGLGYDFSEMEILAHTSSLYYSSILISISSFLERKMFQLCLIAEKTHLTKLKSISGKTGIYKYREYLTTVVGIDLTEIENEWKVVITKSQFRNKLVHESESPDSESPSPHLTVSALQEYLNEIYKILNHITYERV